MQYTHLGRTGLQVSRLCLGTMNFGPYTGESDSHLIMDKAIDLGINFFDTANVYGWKTGESITEKIIGNWFAKGSGRREKTVIATKVYGNMGDWPNQSKLSALNIKRACEYSLKNLKTDYIDLYQMHHVDRETPWEEIWQAMEQLVKEGKVLYIGSSNFAGWHIAQANELAKNRHFMGLVSEQCLYNLIDRTAEMDVIPACESYGMGVIPWSPLSSGALGGALKKAAEGRRSQGGVQEKVEKHRAKLEKFEAFCAELNHNPAHIALAWLLSNKVVTAPIIGPRTEQQLEDTLKALEIDVSAEIKEKLDEIFPGPGGPSPEAWAW
jgi:aryl-alcohol dehydrogenase-like predicted oxidoreductase